MGDLSSPPQPIHLPVSLAPTYTRVRVVASAKCGRAVALRLATGTRSGFPHYEQRPEIRRY
jgi:hypothetical protein